MIRKMRMLLIAALGIVSAEADLRPIAFETPSLTVTTREDVTNARDGEISFRLRLHE